MSCYNCRKNNIENFVQFPTAHADQLVKNVYNPQHVQSRPAPFPMQRTLYDLNMLNKWEVWENPKPTWMSYPDKNSNMMDVSNSNL